MFDRRKAKKIKHDLEARWPKAQFTVLVDGGKVSVSHDGGYNYIDELPTYEQAVSEMTMVIRQTIPGFEWTGYDTHEGERVLCGRDRTRRA